MHLEGRFLRWCCFSLPSLRTSCFLMAACVRLSFELLIFLLTSRKHKSQTLVFSLITMHVYSYQSVTYGLFLSMPEIS
jgi:hypothetical protein